MITQFPVTISTTPTELANFLANQAAGHEIGGKTDGDGVVTLVVYDKRPKSISAAEWKKQMLVANVARDIVLDQLRGLPGGERLLEKLHDPSLKPARTTTVEKFNETLATAAKHYQQVAASVSGPKATLFRRERAGEAAEGAAVERRQPTPDIVAGELGEPSIPQRDQIASAFGGLIPKKN